MDDLIVPSTNKEESLQNWEILLKTAAENGLDINWANCSFLKRKILFLGHIIEDGRIQPPDHKRAAVKNFPIPKNIKKYPIVSWFNWIFLEIYTKLRNNIQTAE